MSGDDNYKKKESLKKIRKRISEDIFDLFSDMVSNKIETVTKDHSYEIKEIRENKASTLVYTQQNKHFPLTGLENVIKMKEYDKYTEDEKEKILFMVIDVRRKTAERISGIIYECVYDSVKEYVNNRFEKYDLITKENVELIESQFNLFEYGKLIRNWRDKIIDQFVFLKKEGHVDTWEYGKLFSNEWEKNLSNQLNYVTKEISKNIAMDLINGVDKILEIM